MKLNEWVKNISRLRINRPTVKEYKRLDFAERTLNFDKQFFKNFINSIKQEDLITYPSYKDYLDIRKLIAKNNKSKLENVYFDSGSDACIKNFIHLFCKKNSNIISSTPSFPMYKIYSQFYQTKFIGIKYDNDLKFDLKKIIKKINKKTSFIILANPNSPFGDYKKISEIEAFCKILKKRKIPLLLDEAYVDFAPSSLVKLTKKYKNLFVLKTLSKSWGAAGIRFGYIIGDKSVVNLLNNLQLTYPVSNISLKFAKYLLNNQKINKKYSDQTKKNRDYMCKILKKNNYDVVNSQTNSIHLHEKNGDNLKTINSLKKSGFSFKYGSSLTGTKVEIPGDRRTNWIRISIGSKKDIKLVKIFESNIKRISNFYVSQER